MASRVVACCALTIEAVTLCQTYPWLQYVKIIVLGGLTLYCFAGILSQVIKETTKYQEVKKTEHEKE